MTVWRLKERKDPERPPRGQACDAEQRVAQSGLRWGAQVWREDNGLM